MVPLQPNPRKLCGLTPAHASRSRAGSLDFSPSWGTWKSPNFSACTLSEKTKEGVGPSSQRALPRACSTPPCRLSVDVNHEGKVMTHSNLPQPAGGGLAGMGASCNKVHHSEVLTEAKVEPELLLSPGSDKMAHPFPCLGGIKGS